MIKMIYYTIGIADESDECYYDTINGNDNFDTREQAEQEIKERLNAWGYAEGWSRSDYDIAKVTIIIERS